MTVASLLSAKTQTAAIPAASRRPTSDTNAFLAGAYNAFLSSSALGRAVESQKVAERDTEFEGLTGKRPHEVVTLDGRFTSPSIGERVQNFFNPEDRRDNIREKTDALIIEQRKSDPRFNRVKTREEIRRGIQAQRDIAGQVTAESVEAGGASAVISSFAGGMAGSLLDPVNLAASFVGFGASTSILRTAAQEGLINIAAETSQIPGRIEWERDLGQKYGFGEAARDVALAGAGGAAFAAAIKGGGKAIEATVGALDKRRSVGMEVLDKVASNKALPSEVRDAAANAARVAHVDEQIPVVRPRIDDVATHRRNVEEFDTAIREGRQPDIKDFTPATYRDVSVIDDIGRPIEVSDGVFFIPTESLAVNLRAVQDDPLGDVSAAMRQAADDYAEAVQESVTRALSRNGIDVVSASGSAAEKVWRVARRPAGGQPRGKEVTVKFAEPDKKVSDADIVTRWGDDVNSIARRVFDKVEGAEPRSVLPPKAEPLPQPQAKYTNIFDQEGVFPESETSAWVGPDMRAAKEADFARLALEAGNEQIDIDGVLYKISDIKKLIDEDDNVLTAMTGCAIA